MAGMEFPYLPFSFVWRSMWPIVILSGLGLLSIVVGVVLLLVWLFHHVQFV